MILGMKKVMNGWTVPVREGEVPQDTKCSCRAALTHLFLLALPRGVTTLSILLKGGRLDRPSL